MHLLSPQYYGKGAVSWHLYDAEMRVKSVKFNSYYYNSVLQTKEECSCLTLVQTNNTVLKVIEEISVVTNLFRRALAMFPEELHFKY